jgi:hypothetical protein
MVKTLKYFSPALTLGLAACAGDDRPAQTPGDQGPAIKGNGNTSPAGATGTVGNQNQTGNNPPTIESISPNPVIANAGLAFTVTVSGKDPAGAQLVYGITCLGKQESNSSGSFVFQVPQNAQTQTVQCGAMVARSGNSAANKQQTFSVQIRGSNNGTNSNGTNSNSPFQPTQQELYQQQSQQMIFGALGNLFTGIINNTFNRQPYQLQPPFPGK